jgi:hypothetical protein
MMNGGNSHKTLTGHRTKDGTTQPLKHKEHKTTDTETAD